MRDMLAEPLAGIIVGGLVAIVLAGKEIERVFDGPHWYIAIPLVIALVWLVGSFLRIEQEHGNCRATLEKHGLKPGD